MGGGCNLIVVQMFVDNPPDNIEASCQTEGEWNLECSGVCIFARIVCACVCVWGGGLSTSLLDPLSGFQSDLQFGI